MDYSGAVTIKYRIVLAGGTMAMKTLTCPHCGFFRDLDEALLPPAGTVVNCPKCRGKFPLLIDDSQRAGEAPLALMQPASVAPGEASTALQGTQTTQEPQGTQGTERLQSTDVPSLTPYSSPSPTPVAAPVRRRTLSFCFTGNAKEYFGIWMVNTLLRIVTLGIYSPWAKVRKRRYFYGNTLLDDASFDYLADPLAILKGWFIAGAFFGLYSLASNTSPIAAGVMMLLFAGLYPWVIVRSTVFNLRNSSHRNIRFSFQPDYQEAYKVFLCWALLVPVTLGILAPYVVYRQKRFLVENSAYGTTLFQFDAGPKDFYRIFSPVFLLVALGLTAMGAMYLLPQQGGNPMLALAATFAFIAGYLVVGLYLPTALTNLSWSATSIAGHRFGSALRVRDLAWIYLSNAVAVICSLGLLAPWTAVRLARYRLDKLTLSGVGSLNTIVAAENEIMGATGEELGDMFGLDMGL
jgi:uncharacterized membrane protein YjgN (DUF898 family)